MATTVHEQRSITDPATLLAEFKEALDRLELTEAFRKAVEIGHWHGKQEGLAAAHGARVGCSGRRGVTVMTILHEAPADAPRVVARVTFRGFTCPLHPHALLSGGPRWLHCPENGGHRVFATAAEDYLYGGAP